MDEVQQGLLRALCFYDVCDYPPTWIELATSWDCGMCVTSDVPSSAIMIAFDVLKQRGIIRESAGRVILAGREALIEEHASREALFPRKLRKARRVTRWLRRLAGVRFVALCNTTALAHSRDKGDLDFFIITRNGSLWQSRAWAAVPFKLFHDRPVPGVERADAVCLSFFIDEEALELTSLQLSNDDPYFRHWFLSLLPLYDDGIGEKLWQANRVITQRHPHAVQWIANPAIAFRKVYPRIPYLSCLEPPARKLQQAAFPPKIREGMNKDTRVVVNDHVLKFHAEDDARAKLRDEYVQNCKKYGIDP